MRALLIGGGGREHAIGLSIVKSGTELAILSHNRNPGLLRIAKKVIIGDENDREFVLKNALKVKPDCVFIGSESPLANGVSDSLLANGFRVFAPTSSAARLETSKSYCREFMKENEIRGNIESRSFSDPEEAQEYIEGIDYDFVIKPDGLTGGKGVVVQGIHFQSKAEGIKLVHDYLSSKQSRIVIERRMIGEEFSLQAFVFGKRIDFLPLVQDYKRAYENDKGPNTGGMGSICFSEAGLPFIDDATAEEAREIMRNVVSTFANKVENYVGPIYGGFISTSQGPKLLEINARLGDPEAINVLSLMNNSIFDVAVAMYNSRDFSLEFRKRVNILRYLVPEGYGSKPVPSRIQIDEEKLMLRGLKIIYASVNLKGKEFLQTTSRSLALLSEDVDLRSAVRRFENISPLIKGSYSMRDDIGTEMAIENKKNFMDRLLVRGS